MGGDPWAALPEGRGGGIFVVGTASVIITGQSIVSGNTVSVRATLRTHTATPPSVRSHLASLRSLARAPRTPSRLARS